MLSFHLRFSDLLGLPVESVQKRGSVVVSVDDNEVEMSIGRKRKLHYPISYVWLILCYLLIVLINIYFDNIEFTIYLLSDMYISSMVALFACFKFVVLVYISSSILPLFFLIILSKIRRLLCAITFTCIAISMVSVMFLFF